ncbi:MAG: FadR family transcriptional regulator [Peptococcaceae bacterium]|jgi:GntR family transcriptional repressor for pyruvate dehydrogenase complex|nr:FadR family transcriptional regulator [Peptococcaceae bacterium]
MDRQYKIIKSSYADIVANQIKRMIINGSFSTGDRLPTEQELSEMFGVGRTTIREAITALCAIGLIERQKHATFVKNIANMCLEPIQNFILLKNIDLAQIFEARLALEPSLCGWAASRRTDKDLENIITFQQELAEIEQTATAESAQTADRFVEANFNFHFAIAKASQNIILADLLLSIVQILKDRQKEIMDVPNINQTIIQEHGSIVSAIQRQDPVQASEKMRIHLEKALQNHLALLEHPSITLNSAHTYTPC